VGLERSKIDGKLVAKFIVLAVMFDFKFRSLFSSH
jgi:hypothetical protein